MRDVLHSMSSIMRCWAVAMLSMRLMKVLAIRSRGESQRATCKPIAEEDEPEDDDMPPIIGTTDLAPPRQE